MDYVVINKNKGLYRFATVVFTLLAIIFCIRQIVEPDVWWQIKTGQFILNNGYVPKIDVFSYTYNGDPWINVKWFTEVVMAVISNAFQPEFLMLLQLTALLSILYFLKSTTQYLSQLFDLSFSDIKAALLLGFLLFLVGMSFRLNGRPEMVSHFFTTLYMLSLVKYRVKPSNTIALLIVFQMLWANMHEAYGVGIVLLLIYTIVSWIEYFIQKNKSYKYSLKDLWRLSLVSLLSVLSPAIHPSGYKMIWHPYEIYTQLGDNKFTTELFNFKSPEYWTIASAVSILFLLLCAIFLIREFAKKKVWIQKIGWGYIMLFLALAYLNFSAYRNIPFLLIAATPLVVLALAEFIQPTRKAYWSIIIISMGLYMMVGSGLFYENFLHNEKYGLRVDPSTTPIGGAHFLKENEIKGNGFVDYLSSAYLLWDLDDDYKTYLDLRDLDIFEARFIENIITSYVQPSMPTRFKGKDLFGLLDSLDNFNYVLMVNKPQFAPILKYLHKSKDYQLVYCDLSSSIFLKNNEENKALIEKYGGNVAETFHPHKAKKTPKAAVLISRILWPLYEEIDYDKLNYTQSRYVLNNMLNR